MQRRTKHGTRSVIAMCALFLLALAAAPALAQAPGMGPGPGGPPPGPGPAMGPGPGPGMGPGPAGPRGQWWRNPTAREALGLTDEQVKQIEDAWYASVTAETDLRAEAEKAHLELARLLHQETLDDRALGQAIDRVVQADAALARNRLERRVAIARILTPEQRGRLENMMKRRRGPRPPKGGPRGMHHRRHHRRW